MSEHQSFWRSTQGMATLFMIGAVSYFLLIEHRMHLFQGLPFLILLLCPVMHLFMHGGHGNHGNTEGIDDAYQRGLEEGRRRAIDDKGSDREGD
jgi:hypothetical protein